MLNYYSDALYEACQKGKIVKWSFKIKIIVSTSRPLELLHNYVFWPLHTESISGKKYGLVIVDDYSRWAWVKFLITIYEAYDVLSHFCIQVLEPVMGSATITWLRRRWRWTWWSVLINFKACVGHANL